MALTLSVLMALTSISTDIYLPAMPTMQKDLHGDIELSITSFLIGFAIAQLFWGPISDRYGRKKPLLIGMVLFIIGSIGCALSVNITQIVLWRVFQAIGACTGPMLARAIIRDVFSKTKAAHMLSTLTMIMAVAPIVGPFCGGQIIKYSTWHSIFILMAIIAVIAIVSIFFLPETLLEENKHKSSLASSFLKYFALIKNRNYMQYTLCLTFFYMAAYAFIVGSPFVYIEYFKIQPQYYGYLFALNVIGVAILSFANRILIKYFNLTNLLKLALLISLFGTIVLAISAYFEFGGIYMIIIPVLIFFSMNGIVAANSTVIALDFVPPDMVGRASALLGALQYGSGIVSSFFLVILSSDTPWTMSYLMLIFVVLSTFFAFLKKKV